MKGVEGLPLRYIIVVLVAALVVGIVLQFVGTLKTGILGGAEKMQTEVSGNIEKSLDQTGPVVNAVYICPNDKFNETCDKITEMQTFNYKVNESWCNTDKYLFANVTDEGGAGINPYTGVFTYINDKSYGMALYRDDIYGPVKFKLTNKTRIGVYAKDENGNAQQKYIWFNVTCK